MEYSKQTIIESFEQSRNTQKIATDDLRKEELRIVNF